MLTNVCGYRLNTFGIIIGWIGTIGSVLAIVLCAVGLANVDYIVKEITKDTNNPNINPESASVLILVLLSVYITLSAINLTASALLIVGTTKERHLLLVPWLINSGISLFFSAIYVLSILYANIVMGLYTSTPFGSVITSLLFGVFNFVLQFYIWYGIYSLFKQIQGTRDLQQRLIPATASSYPSYTKI